MRKVHRSFILLFEGLLVVLAPIPLTDPLFSVSPQFMTMQASEFLLENLMLRVATDCVEVDPFDLLLMPQYVENLPAMYTKGQHRNGTWLTQKYLVARALSGTFVFLDVFTAGAVGGGAAVHYLPRGALSFIPLAQGIMQTWQHYFEIPDHGAANAANVLDF